MGVLGEINVWIVGFNKADCTPQWGMYHTIHWSLNRIKSRGKSNLLPLLFLLPELSPLVWPQSGIYIILPTSQAFKHGVNYTTDSCVSSLQIADHGTYYNCLSQYAITYIFFIYQFSHSAVSCSLHGLQHSYLPCPSTTHRTYSNSFPLIR